MIVINDKYTNFITIITTTIVTTIIIVAVNVFVSYIAIGYASTNNDQMMSDDPIANDGGDIPVYTPYASDTFESFNRCMFEVNKKIQSGAGDGMTKIYNSLFPDEESRTLLNNFLYNFSEPIYMVNSLLQFDFENFCISFVRFFVNSTVGLFGIFDIVKKGGGPQSKPFMFSDTLRAWGVNTGPYLMLPLIGPSNARTITGDIFGALLNPLNIFVPLVLPISTIILKSMVKQAKYAKAGSMLSEMSLDEYSMLRSVYAQTDESKRPEIIKNYCLIKCYNEAGR